MDSVYDKYEAVIGLEVHAQLLTKSKAYSSDPNEYGSVPNTNVSPVTLGHPGTLPRMNKKVVELAVRLGLACKSNVARDMFFARKNYFYPDLPKGYQITQDTTPICTGGSIIIKDDNGNDKEIKITRIHMEEDAGKSIHDQDPYDTLVDLNRAGVPLVEIVSEPDIRTSTEAYNYLTEIRQLVQYLDVCDGNMEEGSLRCDANISVMLKGAKVYGQRTEVKNMNSIRNVQRAIDYEIKRQIDVIEAGGKIEMETRNFDAVSGKTSSMRSKEMAHDYRYFPEPDLQPVVLTEAYIHTIKSNLPALPKELFEKYTKELNLSEYDAYNLTDTKELAFYFEEVIKYTSNYKAAANWIMGSVKSYLNQNAIEIQDFTVKPVFVADLIKLIDEGKISNTLASQQVFPAMIEQPSVSPLELCEKNNWIQNSDSDEIAELVKQAVAKFPDKVKEYHDGKTGLVGLFMGEVMKLSKGKADPKTASKLVVDHLNTLK
jgi:aspartyl-tRNA(Asn)/glutamyl-tRNA(Gln) amidotransferase subunit B